MAKEIFNLLEKEISNLHAAGLFHDEYSTGQKQQGQIEIDTSRFIDLTSNDFLGLADSKEVLDAAKTAVDLYGVGTGSHRFVAGTGQIHQKLEKEISAFFEKEDTAIYSSLYQANSGLFESLLNHQDYVFAHMNCHPAIVEGLQLSKARKHYWGYGDLSDLEDQLKRSPRARFRFIVVEGVFSSDGRISNLEGICDLADEYDATLVVHDTYGLGILGESGRGSAEECGVLERIDILMGGFGVALSGVELGFITGNKDLIRWLKQKSKPYVFSSSPSPALVAAASKSLELAQLEQSRRGALKAKVSGFRRSLNEAGFRLIKSDHPIVAILTNDAVKTQKAVDALYAESIFVMGLCYPVVAKGFARLVCHVNYSHSPEQLATVLNALTKVGRDLRFVKG